MHEIQCRIELVQFRHILLARRDFAEDFRVPNLFCIISDFLQRGTPWNFTFDVVASLRRGDERYTNARGDFLIFECEYSAQPSLIGFIGRLGGKFCEPVRGLVSPNERFPSTRRIEVAAEIYCPRCRPVPSLILSAQA